MTFVHNDNKKYYRPPLEILVKYDKKLFLERPFYFILCDLTKRIS